MKAAHYRVMLTAEGDLINPEHAAEKLGVQVNTVKKYLRMLVKEGLVQVVEPGIYKLTDKGKLFLESINASRSGGSGVEYVVTDPSTGSPIPLKFRNYEQLLAIYRYNLAPVSVLEEHFRRGYVTAWVKSIGDRYLAKLIEDGVIKDFKSFIEYLEKIVDVTRECSSTSRL